MQHTFRKAGCFPNILYAAIQREVSSNFASSFHTRFHVLNLVVSSASHNYAALNFELARIVEQLSIRQNLAPIVHITDHIPVKRAFVHAS